MDHLQQQLFPLDSLGQRYIAAISPGRGAKKDHWRIVAAQDNVTITTNPPQPGAHNVTINKGDMVKLFSSQSFEINATGKVSVGQFLVAQAQTSQGIGDPAFILAVPVERFREDYIVLTPTGYSEDYVNVIRPASPPITLNGALVNATFTPVGDGSYEFAAIRVQAGVQVVESTQPFGMAAYGYSNAVSYAYPGGLNLVTPAGGPE